MFDSVVNVRECGALGDGTMLCTENIQKAIDAAAEKGGATVLVPPGVYITGTLFLRSRINLWLEPGAVIRGSENLDDYPHQDTMLNDKKPGCKHLLVARDCEHVAVAGGGVIDGSGPAFWEPQKAPNTWIKAKTERVGRMVEFVNCRDSALRDITLTNSPGWTCHLHDCDRMLIDNVQIRNNLFGPNTDGFDITSCRDVRIANCVVETGDDAIVIKTKCSERSCERITVVNCNLQTNCVGLKVGTETHRDVRQITIANCTVTRSTRAFGLYSIDGNVVEDVTISNIACDTDAGFILNRPIHIDVRRRTDESGFATIRNVVVSNFIARTDGRILMTAEEGCTLENIVLRDIILHYPKIDDPAPTGASAGSKQFSNRSPQARVARAAIVADTIRNLVVDNCIIDWPESENETPMHAIWARNVRGGVFRCPLARASQDTLQRYYLEQSTIGRME